MLDPAIPYPGNLSGGDGSALLRKMRKALFQPYKIPGFVKRQYEHNFLRVQGSQIIWPAPGRAVLVGLSLPRPRPGQVLVLTHTSLVSPGTERAFFNRLPNTQVRYPYAPGYTGAGTVVEVGPEVTRFQVGDRVAAKLPHASIAVVKNDDLIPVPDTVTLEQACFMWLGVIALQGVRKAHLQFGERVVILGQGPIGQLVTQLTALAGVYPITAVAASAARLPLAMQSGAHATLSLAENSGQIDQLEADVTFEVSGHPQAIRTAIRCTRPGGRIIVLGSTRGTTRALDFEQLAAKGLTLIGASAATLPVVQSLHGWWTAEKEADTFLQLVAQRRLNVDALTSDEIYPSEAERFYRRLAWGDKSIVGGLFRWDRLPEKERFDGCLRQALAEREVGAYVRAQFSSLTGRPTATKGASSTSNANPMENVTMEADRMPLRIGLIGCGEIAVSNARAVQAAPNAMIAAVADVNEAVAQDMAERYEVPYSTTADDLLARDDVDAVLISVPHFLHAPLAIQAVRAGKHVIVEKPMATTLAEADEMLAAAREAGVHLVTLYCQRYLPYVQRAKALIDQGAVGKILGVAFQYYTDKPVSYYTSGFSGRVATEWRLSKEKSGGGILTFNLVHYLDMIRYLTGLEVTRVYGDFGALETPLETEDTISVTLRFSNQAIGSLTASAVVRGTPLTQLRIWGADGQIILTQPNHHLFYTLRQIDGYKLGEWHSLGDLPTGGDRQEFVTRFARAILQGEAPEMASEPGRAVQAIVEAIYQSGERRCPVVPQMLITPELQETP